MVNKGEKKGEPVTQEDGEKWDRLREVRIRLKMRTDSFLDHATRADALESKVYARWAMEDLDKIWDVIGHYWEGGPDDFQEEAKK